MPQVKEIFDICHSGKGYKTISEAFEVLWTDVDMEQQQERNPWRPFPLKNFDKAQENI